MFKRFRQRSNDMEIMDDLSCSGEVVRQTLFELEVINKWLGGNNATRDGVHRLLKMKNIKAEITLADLGCGGGDMLRQLNRWSKKMKVTVKLVGIDANPNIIEMAKVNTADLPMIRYSVLDIQSDEFKKQCFDIVVATLFFHHFGTEQLIQILEGLKTQVNVGIVINDIHRHWFAYHSIRLLTRYFSRSAMVKYDAPLSVLRAFSKQELVFILQQAGIKNFRIRWRWAFRWQIIIPVN